MGCDRTMDRALFSAMHFEWFSSLLSWEKRTTTRTTGPSDETSLHSFLFLQCSSQTLKYGQCVSTSDWVICMCCPQPLKCVSECQLMYMSVYVSLWGSRRVLGKLWQPQGYPPAWHQNKWMPLIITAYNVCISITLPFRVIKHVSCSFAEGALSDTSCHYLFIAPGDVPHPLLVGTVTI